MRDDPGSIFNEPALFLQALANGRRLHVLTLLNQAEWDVTSLAAAVGLSQSAASQHLAKLQAACLVTIRHEAQTIWYRCNSKAVNDILMLLASSFHVPANVAEAA